MEWARQELKTKWGRIVVFIAVCILIYSLIDDVRGFLRKKDLPPPAPSINLTTQGHPAPAASPAVIVLQGREESKTTIGVTDKQVDRDTGKPVDLKLTQEDGKFYVSINGSKPIEVPIDTTRDSMLKDKTVEVNTSSTMKLNISTPPQLFRIGPGVNTRKEWTLHESGKLVGSVGWWATQDLTGSNKQYKFGIDLPVMGDAKNRK